MNRKLKTALLLLVFTNLKALAHIHISGKVCDLQPIVTHTGTTVPFKVTTSGIITNVEGKLFTNLQEYTPIFHNSELYRR